MTPERWAQVKALFGESLDMLPAERAAFLARVPDADLVAEVQSLLEAHEQPGTFLDTEAQDFRAAAFAASSAARSRIGERIGAYRIVGVLGAGGMGDVFEAVRDDDQYHAQVAIKLMRADMRSSLTEQRFRSERQILAGLDHRNIARLFDGGTTEAGIPYVVMERVIGEPIDRYCRARDLAVRDRVQLFLQVCAAVSYAHQHLIVHRDLKPNNILVTADGSAKLLDFGIAKLLEADADTAVEANETATTMRAMTLEYASPEQVSGEPVTTVSDVYSLGVVLYRLLTGHSPYGARTNDAQRVAEILSDTTPTRPSQLQRRLDGDLDNILLMALRKEPQRRYGSVEQLANDLRNYLAGMPVAARGTALRYRAEKFIRRRKGEIAAGFLVTCALLGALFFSVREARIAEQQRQVAQQHFDSVRKLANTLLFELHDEIEQVPGSTKTREMLVKTSLEYLDTLYRGAGTDRALQEELAVAYKKVGDIQGDEVAANTGEYKAAAQSYGRSIALLEPIVAAEPDNSRVGFFLARTYTLRAQVMLAIGATDEALVLAQKGLALTEALQADIANGSERVEQLRAAYSVHADVLFFLGRTLESMASLDKLLALAEEYWRSNPEDEAALFSLSRAYNSASLHPDSRLSESAALTRAIELLRKGLATDEKLVALKPESPKYRRLLMVSQANLARLLFVKQDYAEALDLYRLAAPAAAKRAQDTNDAQAQYLSALVHTGLARALLQAGEVEQARLIFVASGNILEKLAEQDNMLRIVFARGQNAVRLGELYAGLASDQTLSAAAQLAYWLQARDSLRVGIAAVKKVTEAVELEPLDRSVLDDGVVVLARADAAITRLEASK
jgi:tRNA A-37 threonylcarbamoyl transferase component Bud32/tetratricopeptide (TPR) repeat protein